MTNSMTAFAQREANTLSWEIRSVNHRYLDHSFKMPDQFRAIEGELRQLLKQTIFRGKVDCLLRLNPDTDDSARLQVNEQALHQLRNALDQVSRIMGTSPPVSPLELLRFPGVTQTSTVLQEDIFAQATHLFEATLADLIAMRTREGEELRSIIFDKLAELQILTNAVRVEAPIISARQKARLDERLNELQIDVDSNRLEQELVYLAQKSDIAEELDRLDTHIAEVKSTLDTPGAVGRRLDFLMQELNREANTLSSKAVAANTSIQAVELKVIIEQMREQIQNIE
ncbi:MAG: YicC family protein [Pseudomonadales bacterium]|jgi:uncharacterized protein (TIGR00255 family)|nr:YicC family protein [Pseudomonadales bacterium]MDP4911733.1 YicC family protein [Pseudomonadales bacterium]MDP5059079.1 YicC family protein [Pseudomonadales bacterium]